MTNRLNPIMNLLTNDNQCAYKNKRSTMDVIYYIKTNSLKKTLKDISHSTYRKHLIESIEINYGGYYMKRTPVKIYT